MERRHAHSSFGVYHSQLMKLAANSRGLLIAITWYKKNSKYHREERENVPKIGPSDHLSGFDYPARSDFRPE